MSEKPKLSFYTNIPTPYQLSFFNELAKLFELKVIFYSITEGDRTWTFDFNLPYEVIILKNNFLATLMQRVIFDFHFSWQIFSLAWKDKSNFVIVGGAYYIPNAAITMLLSKIRNRKIAFFSEPLFEVKSKFKYFVKWLFLRIVNYSCNAIFCVGKKASESFQSYGVTVPKFIIPYNIDSKSFVKLNQDKVSDFISKYKKAAEFIILSSGSLIPRKGMDILINAFKLINNPKIKLIIIGGGIEKEALLELIGSDKRIVLADFQEPENIPYFFAIADMFAFASRYDGWAVVINEAIAANLPIISSTNVGAAVDLITSPELGLLCESDNIIAFKESIEKLTSDKLIYEKIKEQSLKLIPLISSDYNAKRVFDIFHYEI